MLEREYHPSRGCSGQTGRSEGLPPPQDISECTGLKGGLFANYALEFKRNARATTPFLG